MSTNVARLAIAVATKIVESHGFEYADTFTRVACAKIRSMPRNPRVVLARDHAIAVVKWSTCWSYPEVAALFGMDHTSIIAAVRRHEKRINS